MVLREADLPPSVPLSRAVLGNLSSLAHISCAAAQTYEPAASASGSVALTRDYITRDHTTHANHTGSRECRNLDRWPGAANAHTPREAVLRIERLGAYTKSEGPDPFRKESGPSPWQKPET